MVQIQNHPEQATPHHQVESSSSAAYVLVNTWFVILHSGLSLHGHAANPASDSRHLNFSLGQFLCCTIAIEPRSSSRTYVEFERMHARVLHEALT